MQPYFISVHHSAWLVPSEQQWTNINWKHKGGSFLHSPVLLSFKQQLVCLFPLPMEITHFLLPVNSALYCLTTSLRKHGVLSLQSCNANTEIKPTHLGNLLLTLYCFVFSKRPIFYLLLYNQEIPCLCKAIYQHTISSSVWPVLFQKLMVSFNLNHFHTKLIRNKHHYTDVELHWDNFADEFLLIDKS